MDQGSQYQTPNLKVGTGKSRKYFGTNRYRQDFLNGTPESQQLKDSIDKWDFIKLKSFCSKEMVSKLKKTPTEWEKILEFGV
jgi:hypothetical protein